MEISSSIINQWEEVDMVSKEVMKIIKILMINPTIKIIPNKTDKETIILNSKITITLTDSMIKVKASHQGNNTMISKASKVKDNITLVKDTIKKIFIAEIEGFRIKGPETLAGIITEEGMEVTKDSITMILGTINQFKKTFLHLNLSLLNPMHQSEFHNKINHHLLIQGPF